MVSQKQKVILSCTVFNLLLEFWVHGIGDFLNPVLTISLFLMYLSLFSIIEDLIVRYKLKDQHVLLISFIYGMFQETFNTGSVFNEPNFFGVNLLYVFMINILWWGILQSLLALYFANQIVKADSEFQKEMGPIGWILAIGFNILLLIGSILEGNLPPAAPLDYGICILFMVIALVVFIIINRHNEPKQVEQNKIFNILLKIQIILCLIIGFAYIVIGYYIAVYLFMIWAVVIGILYIGFRAKGKPLVG